MAMSLDGLETLEGNFLYYHKNSKNLDTKILTIIVLKMEEFSFTMQ